MALALEINGIKRSPPAFSSLPNANGRRGLDEDKVCTHREKVEVMHMTAAENGAETEKDERSFRI